MRLPFKQAPLLTHMARPLRMRVAVVAPLPLLLLLGLWVGLLRAEQAAIPSFGKGKIQVRLYTDYFCGPCSRMEPKIEARLADLVARNVINLTLVDTPVHKGTTLYARYFLYILDVERTFTQVLHSRSVLFEAAKSGIEDRDKLEEYLKENGVKFREIDPRPTFAALSSLISEDGIRSTPTCVIIRDGKKSVFSGDPDITKALQSLD